MTSCSPRLFAALAPGGELAVQMPDNLSEPTHRLMREVASAGPWASVLRDALRVRPPIPPADSYYDLLANEARAIDIWRTTYITPWLQQQRSSIGCGLPVFAPSSTLCQTRSAAHFWPSTNSALPKRTPARADGKRLLAFPRLFIVARREH